MRVYMYVCVYMAISTLIYLITYFNNSEKNLVAISMNIIKFIFLSSLFFPLSQFHYAYLEIFYE